MPIFFKYFSYDERQKKNQGRKGKRKCRKGERDEEKEKENANILKFFLKVNEQIKGKFRHTFTLTHLSVLCACQR